MKKFRKVLDGLTTSSPGGTIGSPSCGSAAGTPTAAPTPREIDVQETLVSENFQLCKTVRHGFPYQPTALAFDPVQKILAIGSRSGGVRMYEDDVAKIKKQADTLQHNLDNEILQKNRLQSDFDEAIVALLEEREKNKDLQNQLDKATLSRFSKSNWHRSALRMNCSLQGIKTMFPKSNSRSDLEKILTAYEDQQEAHKLSLEMFSVQLDAEREKHKVLKQDLDKICTSQCEINKKYETGVTMVTQQANTLQHEPQADLALHNLRAEQEAEEINILHQNASEEENSERELDELKTQLSVQSCVSLNLKLSTELKAEREAPQKIRMSEDVRMSPTSSMNPSVMQSHVFQRKCWWSSRTSSVPHLPTNPSKVLREIFHRRQQNHLLSGRESVTFWV
ncbi:Syntaxin-binding protein 5-like [Nibea albiflora]|uniref:Syntaxin-binding protein 5-like n=1 Tax=Nibea albiflora TaxID=240163 RepID=A0ACB7EIU1_NIBAL|nr:Syntaxin-binding protein 5-like [Nibea albiflora]